MSVFDAAARGCPLPVSPRQAPRFDFDRDELRPRGERILEQLGDCLKAGRLTGHDVTLVGHADPRGPRPYNQELAESRAEQARAFLIRLGVNPARLSAVSAGEQGAFGYDEATWALDRRVDVELDGDEQGLNRTHRIGVTPCDASR